ncbi:MAG: DUF4157 domain-containing protein [bacterium]|nr:DUF4157 domain-containing protein [bacterium]
MSEADVRTKSNDTVIQAKGSPSGMEVPASFESGLNNIKGSGSPLNKTTRGYYESRLNTYLGDVRVHTGTKADRLARSIDARAFTAGHDIVFAARQFNPESREGKKLLGHELTHVLQQSERERFNAPAMQRKENTIYRKEAKKRLSGPGNIYDYVKSLYEHQTNNRYDAKKAREVITKLAIVNNMKYTQFIRAANARNVDLILTLDNKPSDKNKKSWITHIAEANLEAGMGGDYDFAGAFKLLFGGLFSDGSLSHEDKIKRAKELNKDNAQVGKNIEVVKTITYSGGADFVKKDEDGNVLFVAKNVANQIEIVKGDFVKNPGQWLVIKDFRNKPHYTRKDQKWKVDLDARHSTNLHWWGPNCEFKVDSVYAGDQAAARGYGSLVSISILDEKSSVKGKIHMAHFVMINEEIYKGVGKKFKPGTYIGRTHEKIGYSTGAHMHMTSGVSSVKRGKMSKHLKGK